MPDTAEFRLKAPVHPGKFLHSEVVQPLKLNVTEAAKVLGVTRVALSALFNERSTLSPEMALRFEKAFAVPMETLMRMQSSFDIAKARLKASEIHVERYSQSAI